MTDLREVKGNIFTSKCQTLVNTVNCVGVMGAGIALEFKLRYPEMYQRYVQHCQEGRLKVGKLWLYKNPANNGRQCHWVLNFPTKKHWKYPSKESYLRAGLENFVATYHNRGIESIAFPTLGSQNGGIPEEISVKLMREYLENIEIDVEIYRYDSSAADDLFLELKRTISSTSDVEFANQTSLSARQVEVLRRAVENPSIRSIGHLGKERGVGIKTLEEIFESLSTPRDTSDQLPFDQK